MKLLENTAVAPTLFNIENINLPLKYVNGKTMKVNASNVLDQYYTKRETAIKNK